MKRKKIHLAVNLSIYFNAFFLGVSLLFVEYLMMIWYFLTKNPLHHVPSFSFPFSILPVSTALDGLPVLHPFFIVPWYSPVIPDST